MMKLVCCLLSLCALSQSALAPSSTPQFTNNAGTFKVWWTFNASSSSFTMVMSGATNGYISVGFCDTILMQVADTITGWVPDSSPSTTVLIDELSPDYSQPRDDRTLGGSLDVSAISSEQVGGWTTIQFTRKLITGDGYDYNIGSSDLKLLYAIGRRDGSGNAPRYSYQQHNSYGAATINIPSGYASRELGYPTFNAPGPILLIIVLVVCVCIGIVRYCMTYAFRRPYLPRAVVKRTSLEGGEGPVFGSALGTLYWRVRAVLGSRVPILNQSGGSVLVIMGYILLTFLLLFLYATPYDLGSSFGFMTAANSVALVVFATRNSIITFLTTIPFPSLIPFHRFLGYFTVLLAAVHMFIFWGQWSSSSTGIPAYSRTIGSTWSVSNYLFGFLALMAGVLMCLTALPPIRRKMFELFYYPHVILMILFFIFALIHETRGFLAYFLIVLFIYLADKIVRAIFGLFSVRTTSVVSAGNAVTMTFPKSSLPSCLGRYKTGCVVFVNVPKISWVQWHPFTVASAPGDDVVQVTAHAAGGFTRRLAELLTPDESLRIKVDGPYSHGALAGTRAPVHVLLAGGVGITPALAQLRDMYGVTVDVEARATELHAPMSNVALSDIGVFQINTQTPSRDEANVVYLFWTIRDMGPKDWLFPTLNAISRARSKDPAGLPTLRVAIFVTGKAAQAEARVAPFIPGRPNIAKTVSAVAHHHFGAHVDVMTCGPAGMITDCWDAVTALRFNGHPLHLHVESFDL